MNFLKILFLVYLLLPLHLVLYDEGAHRNTTFPFRELYYLSLSGMELLPVRAGGWLESAGTNWITSAT